MLIKLSAILPVLLLLLGGCSDLSHEDSSVNPIEEVTVFKLDDTLYASVRLSSDYLDAVFKETESGEPVLAYYRFDFYRHQDHFFDKLLGHAVVQRRLRLRLITQRFEMMKLPKNELQYTADENQAMSFLGAPRYVLLGTDIPLSADERYYLSVGFTLEHQGMSWVLGVLKRWLTLTPPIIFTKIVWYEDR
ncbi:MAG: DUF4390 domain-containing protein [Magnetococcales bacterium]|nr:DUF4390 domain-containing protein [Magnetococcales bacterium]